MKTFLCAAGKKTMEKVKSNSRMSQSAGSNAQLAGKWVLKMALLVTIVYVLSTNPKWLPELLKELAEGISSSPLQFFEFLKDVSARKRTHNFYVQTSVISLGRPHL